MNAFCRSAALVSLIALGGCGGGGGGAVAVATPGVATPQAFAAAPDPQPAVAVETATNVTTIDYAQGMGATDSDGLVKAFPLKADNVARRVWVDAVNGNDSNNGFSPTPGCKLNGTGTYGQVGATGCAPGSQSDYGPKKTYMAAVRLFKPTPTLSIGNQILLGQGDTFVESDDATNSDNLVYRNGDGVQYPRVVQSYDKSDPLNENKMGRATGANRPKLRASPAQAGLFITLFTYQTQKADTTQVGNFAVRGIELDAPSSSQSGTVTIGGGGNPQNILIENVVANHVGINIGGADGKNARNIVIRKSSMGWNWDLNGSHSAGLGTGHADNLVVEDCIIYRGGWDSNRDAVNGSGADIFKQGWYASYGSVDQSISRRNVIVDGSASGLSGRGSMKAYHNVLIDNPIQAVAGGSVGDYSKENPTGVLFNYDHNLIIGGADITTSLRRGQGFSLQNGRQGSSANYNLFVNGYQPKLSWSFVFQNSAINDQPSYAEIKGNRAYAFSANFDLNDTVPSAFPNQVFTSKGVVLSEIASASADSNVNSASSPATTLQIYAAAGYAASDEAAAKRALVADMVANPERPWAYRLMKAASPLFGSFDFSLQ